jgi:putative transposase
MNIINELDVFVQTRKESRELKRALAVKMILTGQSYREIQQTLQVSRSFIGEWKNQARKGSRISY